MELAVGKNHGFRHVAAFDLRLRFVLAGAVMCCVSVAQGQLRVACWNITFYPSQGLRTADFQTAIYGVYQGRTLAPDVLFVQEMESQSGVNSFLSMLNNAPGSPNDWEAAAFSDGEDTDNAFFYRRTKVDLLASTVIAVGSSSTLNQPRDTNRYDIRLENYSSVGATIGIYSSHMKAQGGTNHAGRRLIEAQRIRDNAEGLDTNGPGTGLPAGYHFIFGGDTNIQTSSEAAYQELVGSQVNNAGRFFDPINTPGSWNNNSAFRFVHTQDPAGAGGMDDRHDQVLLCASLIDGQGLDYLGNPSLAYSTTTWDDPNHSYRSWGNDGTSYNTTLTINGNAMVGTAIAQALFNAAAGQGHLPVVLNFKVPAKIGSPSVIDFGTVLQGSLAQQTLTVTNAGEVALWNASGIDNLDYTLSATAGFSAPGGAFAEAAGGGGNDHLITMDTSTVGPMNGTLTIASDDPDQPARVVTLIGEVVAACVKCDTDCNSLRDMDDVTAFVDGLLNGTAPCSACAGDVNQDLVRDALDVQGFVDCLLAP